MDGGINDKTAAECARAGADAFISGTSLFEQRSLRAAIATMRKIADANARGGNLDLDTNPAAAKS